MTSSGLVSPSALSPERRHKVDGRLALSPDGEVKGHEETWRGVGHVDLDAAEEDEVSPAIVRVDNGEHLLLDLFVCLHYQVNHDLAGLGDLLAVWRQLAAEPTLHDVLRISRHVRAGSDLAMCGDDGTARRGEGGLARAEELAGLAIRGEANVRAENDEDMPVVRHVVGEGHEARLADVGGPTDAA
eukprot:CAMPEP_0175650722 /NCGR_PEP_ID=MMETSP0097-20121207/9489_1 /TAXON_ID=311494 /ORGANISM="Alexandrium monilatum, Strain CCMP3105" /LENGTH=185 /DNA_ID=CAMNT_0016956671 /DNA_START=146 /DNA_END=704 /DNA_ORIENTATION=-